MGYLYFMLSSFPQPLPSIPTLSCSGSHKRIIIIIIVIVIIKCYIQINTVGRHERKLLSDISKSILFHLTSLYVQQLHLIYLQEMKGPQHSFQTKTSFYQSLIHTWHIWSFDFSNFSPTTPPGSTGWRKRPIEWEVFLNKQSQWTSVSRSSPAASVEVVNDERRLVLSDYLSSALKHVISSFWDFHRKCSGLRPPGFRTVRPSDHPVSLSKCLSGVTST